MHEIWPTGGLPGQLAQDLPTWTHFEQATEVVTIDEATKSTPCGPDVEPVVDVVQEHIDAGYDHIYFHQIGADQDGFFEFWERELSPALAELSNSLRRDERRSA